MTCGIYRIYNKVNGKSYIGQSKNVEGRLRAHFCYLRLGSHWNCHLQSAFLLYGAENFEHQLVEVCEETELTQREEYWIDAALYYAGVYNLARPEDNKKVSVETRRKHSENQKNRKHTEETRRKIGEAAKVAMIGNQNSKGHNPSEEQRRKISEAIKGYKHTEETRRNMSKGQKERWRKHNEKSIVDCSAA